MFFWPPPLVDDLFIFLNVILFRCRNSIHFILFEIPFELTGNKNHQQQKKTNVCCVSSCVLRVSIFSFLSDNKQIKTNIQEELNLKKMF